MNKKAFTLSETLITLAIIGIVASLTIPTLIVKYQKSVTVNKLKKNYSLFAQVFQMAESDYGTSKNWTSLNHNEFAEKYFLPYLPTAQKINTRYHIYSLGKKTHSYYANLLAEGYNGAYMYSLPDGTIFGIFFSSMMDKIIVIDINGIKGPNVTGKDVFHFAINRTTGKFEMYGQGKDRNSLLAPVEQEEELSYISNCAPAYSYYAGVYCGYVIMSDGWKIAPDYPW